MKKLGLQWRIILPVLLVILTSITILSFSVYFKQREIVWNNIDSITHEAILRIVERVEEAEFFISQADNICKESSKRVLASSVTALNNIDWRNDKELREFAINSNIVSISIFDRDGVQISSTTNSDHISHFSYSDIRSNRGEIFSEISGEGVDKVRYIYDLFHNGEYFIAMGFDVGKLFHLKDKYSMMEIVKGTKVGDNGYAIITDLNGITLAHPDPKLLNFDIKTLDWGKEFVSKSEGKLNYVFKGVPKQIHFINKGDRKIGTIIETSDFTQSLDELEGFLILFSIVLLLIISIVIYYIVNIVNRKIKEVINGANDLSLSITNGKLDERIDTETLPEFYPLIDGINEIVESFIKPINVMSRYIEQVAYGEHLAYIEEEYKGEFDKVKQNINGCTKILKDATFEIGSLHKHAINGELGRRADSSYFKGDWIEFLNSMNSILDEALRPIGEVMGVLDEMSKADFSQLVTGEYNGDHADLKNAVNSTLNSLNSVFSNVRSASIMVNSAAEQIASASQSLSSGTTEQAASLEQMTSAMEEITNNSKENTNLALKANELAEKAKNDATKGNEEMERLEKAMNEINGSSKEIISIIKVIDEIAFQTNLLALNAAVEAARAGKHGKGFAVVAEEVRNLAARSAKAAKQTSELIENSITKITTGVELVEKTGQSLTNIVDGSFKVTEMINEMTELTKHQMNQIEQTKSGIEQTSNVTQQNASNAEEMASAAEELSSQAVELEHMIKQFKLIDGFENNSGRQLVERRRDLLEYRK